MADLETRALVAHVERMTGLDVVVVEEKAIAPLLNGTCHACGAPCRFVFVSWCDGCMGDAVGWCDTTGDKLSIYCRDVLGHEHG